MILGVPKFYDVHPLSQNDGGLRALSVVVLIVVLILESKLSITYMYLHTAWGEERVQGTEVHYLPQAEAPPMLCTE